MISKELGKLLQPFSHRGYNFKNRLAMASMTRCRADPGGCPNDLVKTYYSQRAESAGFISSEAMGVLDYCNPWGNSCNVYAPGAIKKWREINDEIHKQKSVIFAQLVHGGRSVHPDYGNGATPIGPSAIAIKGECFVPSGVNKPHVTPREMTKDDIKKVSEAFMTNIKKSIDAGFDGIEFHGANGYLIDEFLRSGSNKRTDEFGGSVENRCRFVLQLVDSALKIVPAEKIGIKISLVGRYQDMFDENPQKLGEYLLKELSKRNILYVNMGSPEAFGDGAKQMANPTAFGKKHFKGLVIGDGNVDVKERLRRLNSGEADMMSFGVLQWANPDLANRLKNDYPLGMPDFKLAYFGGAASYTDIPKYDPKAAK